MKGGTQMSIKAWRHRWRKIRRLMRRRRTHLIVLGRFLLYLGFAICVEFLIIAVLILAGLFGLLDVRTIVSVMVPEVGIGVFLYYFLGERRRGHLDEIVNLMDAYLRLTHLRVLTYKWWFFEFSYVENTVTKRAYKTSDFVDKLTGEGILEEIFCKDEKELRRRLQEDEIQLNERQPSLSELLNPNAKLISKE